MIATVAEFQTHSLPIPTAAPKTVVPTTPVIPKSSAVPHMRSPPLTPALWINRTPLVPGEDEGSDGALDVAQDNLRHWEDHTPLNTPNVSPVRCSPCAKAAAHGKPKNANTWTLAIVRF